MLFSNNLFSQRFDLICIRAQCVWGYLLMQYKRRNISMIRSNLPITLQPIFRSDADNGKLAGRKVSIRLIFILLSPIYIEILPTYTGSEIVPVSSGHVAGIFG